MCGIVGLITNSCTSTDVKFLRHAIIADTIRGPHSTGFIGAEGGEKALYRKAAISGPEFVETEFFAWVESQAPKTLGTTAMIGHNRWATMGEITARNAHPFRHNHVTGVHNGTLWYHDGLADGRGKKFEVDSEAIMYALAMAKDKRTEVLEEICGSFALVWHDDKSDRVYMARNDERPMALAISPDKRTVCFASEMGMLQWLVKKNYHNGWDWEFMVLPEDRLWSFDLASTAPVYDTLEWETFTSYHVAQPKNNWNNYWDEYGLSVTGNVSALPAREDSSQKKHTSTLGTDTNFVITASGAITEVEWKQVAKYGCGYCSSLLHIDEADQCVFMPGSTHDALLCPDCSDFYLEKTNAH